MASSSGFFYCMLQQRPLLGKEYVNKVRHIAVVSTLEFDQYISEGCIVGLLNMLCIGVIMLLIKYNILTDSYTFLSCNARNINTEPFRNQSSAWMVIMPFVGLWSLLVYSYSITKIYAFKVAWYDLIGWLSTEWKSILMIFE